MMAFCLHSERTVDKFRNWRERVGNDVQKRSDRQDLNLDPLLQRIKPLCMEHTDISTRLPMSYFYI